MKDKNTRKYVIAKKDRKPWSEEAKKAQSIRIKEVWRVRKLRKKQGDIERQVKAAKVHMKLVKKQDNKPWLYRLIDVVLGRVA